MSQLHCSLSSLFCLKLQIDYHSVRLHLEPCVIGQRGSRTSHCRREAPLPIRSTAQSNTVMFRHVWHVAPSALSSCVPCGPCGPCAHHAFHHRAARTTCHVLYVPPTAIMQPTTTIPPTYILPPPYILPPTYILPPAYILLASCTKTGTRCTKSLTPFSLRSLMSTP